MPAESRLYETILNLLGHAPWRDRRHLVAVSWMVVGLLSSGWIALSEWTAFVVGRAQYAQSSERRFQRWLANSRIDVLQLYSAVLKDAMGTLKDLRLLVVLDTTMLWNTFCVVQLSLVYRGRAVPLVWKVMKHSSASVAFRDYRGVLGFAVRLLKNYEVVLLADRGFMHGDLLRWCLRQDNWHLRVRCKRDVGIFEKTRHGYLALTLRLSPGEVRYIYNVYLTAEHLPVYIAVGWEKGAKEPWIIVSDQPTDHETLYEYGRRFTIEETFLDHKSNGFQWESSKLSDVNKLQRLCFVMAVATVVLVCQGVAVVAQGKRRYVDPHWFRGQSYARMGWNWLRRAMARGEELIDSLALLTCHDPEPAKASKRQVDRSRWMENLPCRYVFLFSAP